MVSTGGLVIGDPSLEIGVGGPGTLTIQNDGDILTDRTHLSFNAGQTGMATITGTGSSLSAVEVFVGSSGIRTMNTIVGTPSGPLLRLESAFSSTQLRNFLALPAAGTLKL